MKKIFSLLVALLAIASSYAVPARPGWQTKTQPDGTVMKLRLVGDENYYYWINESGDVVRENAEGYWMPVGEKPQAIRERLMAEGNMPMRRQVMAKVPSTGSLKGLVILVNFQDLSILSDNKQSDFDDLMNGDNYTYDGATGSVRKYFIDQSNRKYTPIFDVVGPVTLPNNMSHYGGNDRFGSDLRPGDMIVEACSIANALHNVDFTQYDNDNDGYVDFVYVIYAGKGEADGGTENTIWPHSWDLESAEYYHNCSYDENKRKFDGKKLYQYACSGEIDGAGARTGIGTIAHEFSHVIGLPDLYDTADNTGKNRSTPRGWHVMDYGSYNNDGKTPPNYTIYDKYYLGWETPTNLGNMAQVLTMEAGEGYQLSSSNSLLDATSTNTVYYIENRQQSGWDAALPGHGLLVWKIQYDEGKWYNNTLNNSSPLRYALLTAAGDENKIGSPKDPFPGTGNVTSWSGLANKPLLNITEKNGVISLSYIEVVDETICSYEVLFENATLSSEIGEVEKGSTLTLTVKPAAGYLLDETMIEVEENNVARSFTYTNDTLTITNVQGELGIYIMPEEDPNYLPTANNAATNLDDLNHEVKKILHNGQLLIIRNGRIYTVLGQIK